MTETKTVKIIADSTCDLSKELLTRYDISAVSYTHLSTTEGLEINKWKCIVADEESGKTSKEGVYAGGDAVTGAATVILAMGAGKAAAKGIDEYLRDK